MIAANERTSSDEIRESLQVLDVALRRAVERTRMRTGREPGVDPFRGFYVSEADVRELLDGGATVFGRESRVARMAAGPRFEALARGWSLCGFELDVLLIALAPEVDSRFPQIYGYLQDDVTRKWPTVDLILNLLCDSAPDKAEKRALLGESSPLIRNRLIRLAGDELTPTPQREVVPASRISAFLLGETGLSPAIARFATILTESEICERCFATDVNPGLTKLAQVSHTREEPLVLFFQGESEDAKRAAAIALASQLGRSLMIADLQRASRAGASFEVWLADLSREATLQNALVYREGLNSLANPETADAVLRAISADESVAIFSGRNPWQTTGFPLRGAITVTFEIQAWPQRRDAWKRAVRERGGRLGGQALDSLAECFRFDPGQIDDTVRAAENIACYRDEPVGAEHIFEAARSRSGQELASLTRRIKPSHTWTDIVLPQEASLQLLEICQRVKLRQQVFGKWGFAGKLSSGRGVSALFHGHSGTGKTMAAEVIASDLQLDLYKIDLACVVSKYLGETEKNLDRIFCAAETANAILFFDEADALFGKRSEVRDSHDRYANLEISYLLQKMEQYEGVAILATNLRQNLDDAFLRRLTFSIPFPFPDETSRRRIWAGIWPASAPLAQDLDLDWLAEEFQLSGGNIRNVALAAAYLAIEQGGAENGLIGMPHVLQAVEGEFRKLGKTLTRAELVWPALRVGAAA